MLFIFYFWSWILEKSSKSWASSYKNESHLLLVGMTVCLESFLPTGCRTFICWKKQQNCWSILVWIADCWFSSNILLTSRNPKNNCWISRIFGVRSGGKDYGLCSYNKWSQQVGGLDAFLYEAAQNFEVFSKIQDQNEKIKNLKRLMSFSRPFQRYHSEAYPIWSDPLKHADALPTKLRHTPNINFLSRFIFLMWLLITNVLLMKYTSPSSIIIFITVPRRLFIPALQ